MKPSLTPVTSNSDDNQLLHITLYLYRLEVLFIIRILMDTPSENRKINKRTHSLPSVWPHVRHKAPLRSPCGRLAGTLR